MPPSRRPRLAPLLTALIAALLLPDRATQAQSSGGAFSVQPDVAPAGGTSGGGAFSVTASIGMPLAGDSANGAFRLISGPPSTAVTPPASIFSNGFEGS